MKTKADSPYLHTLIANCGLIMTDAVRPTRWLFPTEALLSQGFPVLPQCRDAGDVFLGACGWVGNLLRGGCFYSASENPRPTHQVSSGCVGSVTANSAVGTLVSNLSERIFWVFQILSTLLALFEALCFSSAAQRSEWPVRSPPSWRCHECFGHEPPPHAQLGLCSIGASFQVAC